MILVEMRLLSRKAHSYTEGKHTARSVLDHAALPWSALAN
jgi:hypothetical protein